MQIDCRSPLLTRCVDPGVPPPGTVDQQPAGLWQGLSDPRLQQPLLARSRAPVAGRLAVLSPDWQGAVRQQWEPVWRAAAAHVLQAWRVNAPPMPAVLHWLPRWQSLGAAPQDGQMQRLVTALPTRIRAPWGPSRAWVSRQAVSAAVLRRLCRDLQAAWLHPERLPDQLRRLEQAGPGLVWHAEVVLPYLLPALPEDPLCPVSHPTVRCVWKRLWPYATATQRRQLASFCLRLAVGGTLPLLDLPWGSWLAELPEPQLLQLLEQLPQLLGCFRPLVSLFGLKILLALPARLPPSVYRRAAELLAQFQNYKETAQMICCGWDDRLLRNYPLLPPLVSKHEPLPAFVLSSMPTAQADALAAQLSRVLAAPSQSAQILQLCLRGLLRLTGHISAACAMRLSQSLCALAQDPQQNCDAVVRCLGRLAERLYQEGAAAAAAQAAAIMACLAAHWESMPAWRPGPNSTGEIGELFCQATVWEALAGGAAHLEPSTLQALCHQVFAATDSLMSPHADQQLQLLTAPAIMQLESVLQKLLPQLPDAWAQFGPRADARYQSVHSEQHWLGCVLLAALAPKLPVASRLPAWHRLCRARPRLRHRRMESLATAMLQPLAVRLQEDALEAAFLAAAAAWRGDGDPEWANVAWELLVPQASAKQLDRALTELAESAPADEALT